MNKQRLFSLNVFLILAMWFNACPPPPANRELRVSHEKLTTRIEMIVAGKHFSSNKPVTISVTNFPKKEGILTWNVTTDGNGDFTRRESFDFREVGRDEEFINILVTARDDSTGQFLIENVSPEPYLIRR